MEGKCPVTGQEMSVDDLVEVKLNEAVRPRPLSATSIPGMLALFQNEWDALMLETYQLKEHLNSVRQELAKTLYQHDAACRVIARLAGERDQARAALEQLQAQGGGGAAAGRGSMEVEDGAEGALPAAVVQQMVQTHTQLQKSRKGRKASKSAASVTALAAFQEVSSHPLHKTNKPGVMCLAADPKNEAQLVTGGKDGGVIVFDRSTKKVVSTTAAHKKPVNDLVVHPTADLIVTASADKTAAFVSSSGKSAGLTCHTASVAAVALHPSGAYVATASADKTWGFHAIDGGSGAPRTLSIVADADTDAPLSALRFHPDGLILATGTSTGVVSVYDAKNQSKLQTFTDHTGAVTGLAFSENGYHMATSSLDGTCKLWDLRKLQNFATLDIGGACSAVAFSDCGQYVAAASDVVQIYKAKKANLVATLEGHSGAINGLLFGADAQWLATAASDRCVKLWGSK